MTMATEADFRGHSRPDQTFSSIAAATARSLGEVCLAPLRVIPSWNGHVGSSRVGKVESNPCPRHYLGTSFNQKRPRRFPQHSGWFQRGFKPMRYTWKASLSTLAAILSSLGKVLWDLAFPQIDLHFIKILLISGFRFLSQKIPDYIY